MIKSKNIRILIDSIKESPTWIKFFDAIHNLLSVNPDSKDSIDAEGDFYSNFKPITLTEEGHEVLHTVDLQQRPIRRHLISEGLRLDEVKSAVFGRMNSTSPYLLQKILNQNNVSGLIEYEFEDSLFPTPGTRNYIIHNSVQILKVVSNSLFLYHSTIEIIPGTDYLLDLPIVAANGSYLRTSANLFPGTYDLVRTNSPLPYEKLPLRSHLSVEIFEESRSPITNKILKRLTPMRCYSDARYVSLKMSNQLNVSSEGIILPRQKVFHFVDDHETPKEILFVRWTEDSYDYGYRRHANVYDSVMALDENIKVCFVPLLTVEDRSILSGNVVNGYFRASVTLEITNVIEHILTIRHEQDEFIVSVEMNEDRDELTVYTTEGSVQTIETKGNDWNVPYFTIEITDGLIIINDVVLNKQPDFPTWDIAYITNVLINSIIEFDGSERKDLTFVPIGQLVHSINLITKDIEKVYVGSYDLDSVEEYPEEIAEFDIDDEIELHFIDTGSTSGSYVTFDGTPLYEELNYNIIVSNDKLRVSPQSPTKDFEKVTVSANEANWTDLVFHTYLLGVCGDLGIEDLNLIIWEYCNPETVSTEVEDDILSPEDFMSTQDPLQTEVEVGSGITDTVITDEETNPENINIEDDLKTPYEGEGPITPN